MNQNFIHTMLSKVLNQGGILKVTLGYVIFYFMRGRTNRELFV